MDQMKKYSIVFLCMLLCLLLTACGKNEQGTYYPDSTEMYHNLDADGYEVSVTNDVNGDMTKTCLTAKKGDDYIVFYWLNEGIDVDPIAAQVKNEYESYDQFVSIQDDSKFGSLVFCGTSNAVNASGIIIVDVKVK